MGKLYVIGTGNGLYENLTIKADRIIKNSELVFCDEKLYEKIKIYYSSEKLIFNDYNATFRRCCNAIDAASNHNIVSILGSGDTGIYGIAGIVLKEVENCKKEVEVEIIPGITSALSGAAMLGAPLVKDFAIISLSENFTTRDELIIKLNNIAKTDLGIVFYSPCNKNFDNLKIAIEVIFKYRPVETIIGIVNNMGYSNQEIIITNLEKFDYEKINSLSTIFITSNETILTKNKKIIKKLY
ncbi:MAG: precorrin-3B C(17)-methyltransferase [Bacilli bacterium]|nr:precorrin-3B C(17)-methyltransferase [Bacilli bacterium]